MAHGGSNFLRLRFGVDRPVDRDQVSDYVLAKFKESQSLLDEKIDQACTLICTYLQQS
jgi:peptidyl-tRNA hydrolase